LDRGEQINLPAVLISHISKIAKTAKDHDLGVWAIIDLYVWALLDSSIEEGGVACFR